MKKVKKYEAGGLAKGTRKGIDTKKLPDDVYATIESDPHFSDRKNRLSQIEEISRKEGRRMGNERQESAQLKSAPAAYLGRGVDFIKDKMSDADVYLSEKMGLDRRAAEKRGMRQGLKDEGYKAGGKVKASSASKRADGIAQRGKTRGRMV